MSLSFWNSQVLRDNGFAEELDQSHLLPIPGKAPPPKALPAAAVQTSAPLYEPSRQTANPGSSSVKQQIYMVSQRILEHLQHCANPWAASMATPQPARATCHVQKATCSMSP